MKESLKVSNPMPRILITLVSDQTLPNVLFILQFGPFDRYLFVTTARMEQSGVSNAIIEACDLKKGEKIIVEPEKVFDILDKIDQIQFGAQEEITVNITGGTKMMSLGAYAAFSRKNHSNIAIYYIPIRSTSVFQIYPDNVEMTLTTQITLDQYLKAYGIITIEYENLNGYKIRFEESKRLLEIIKKDRIPGKISHAVNPNYRKPDKSFYLGKWLEVFAAFFIQKQWDIPESNIRLNMKLTRTNKIVHEDTEYDVVFMKDNKLFIAECKYFSNGEFSKKKINQDWYKLAGLQLHLGLYATPFFITANIISPDQKSYLNDIKDLFRIKGIADIHTIGEANEFTKFLNSIL